MKIHKVAQGTDDWRMLRAGKPSASMFGKIINEKDLLKDEILEKLAGCQQYTPFKKMKVWELREIADSFCVDLTPNLVLASTDYAEELAAEYLGGYKVDEWLPDLDNIHMTHGHESELYATKFYEDETGNECEQVGFVTDDAETYGCSPDRLVGDYGLLEIKSPLAKNVIKYWMEHKETGECPKDFKLQIQGQIMITGREWCDLVLYHPNIQSKIIRVMPDLVIHAKLKETIAELLKNRDAMVSEMAGF